MKVEIRADLAKQDLRIPCDIHEECFFSARDMEHMMYVGTLESDDGLIMVTSPFTPPVHVLYSIDLQFS